MQYKLTVLEHVSHEVIVEANSKEELDKIIDEFSLGYSKYEEVECESVYAEVIEVEDVEDVE